MGPDLAFKMPVFFERGGVPRGHAKTRRGVVATEYGDRKAEHTCWRCARTTRRWVKSEPPLVAETPF